MFSDNDIKFIKERGSDPKEVSLQIENFKKGFPPLQLNKAAVIGDGIIKLEEQHVNEFAKAFEKSLNDLTAIKFVPASGAASRMFKALFEFKSSYGGSEEEYEKLQQEKGDVFDFFKHLDQFAFYDDLKKAYSKVNKESLEEAHIKRKYVSILNALLDEEGLGYGKLPKGLLKFHNYENGSRTPVEEHIIEGIEYAKDKTNKVVIHLTVSPEHREKFESHVRQVKEGYEKKFEVGVEIQYSEQKASTDTIAVDMDNKPFLEDDGKMLFRPGGHGALIENLNDLDTDVIFVKNIDNVVPDRIKGDTFTFKKVLAGILVEKQGKVFDFLKRLEAEPGSESLIKEAIGFIEAELCMILTPEIKTLEMSKLRDKVYHILNRPMRVCGMVKNEGEPGGGPFWVTNESNITALQIVESAQVDMKDDQQKNIFQQSTHFNPVDLVCGVRDYKGEKFDLLKFRDPNTGFIAYKSKGGRDLKAQELPGLWNGAMANWITVFVEVPLITFNPVKKVTDLVKPTHQ